MATGKTRGDLVAFLLLIVAFAALGTSLWSALRVPKPETEPTRSPVISFYTPGGAACDPEHIARLKGDQRIAERGRCAEVAEAHRLTTDDLVQQTRSADAAESIVDLTRALTNYTLLATIVGLLTLIAAGFAAWYARSASAIAKEDLRHSTKVAEYQLRAHLDIDEPTLKRRGWIEDGILLDAMLSLKNFGATPALAITFRTIIAVGDEPISEKDADFAEWEALNDIAQGDHLRCPLEIDLTKEEAQDVSTGLHELWLRADVRYQDVFDNNCSRTVHLVSSKEMDDWDTAAPDEGWRAQVLQPSHLSKWQSPVQTPRTRKP